MSKPTNEPHPLGNRHERRRRAAGYDAPLGVNRPAWNKRRPRAVVRAEFRFELAQLDLIRAGA